MKNILIFLVIVSSLYSDSFQQSKNYIIDNQHQLIWQDTDKNINIQVSHSKAKQYCKNLSLDGLTNWRVPSVDEYKYIIDLSRDDEIMINKSFRYILPAGYWTSDTTWRNFGRWGYYILFKSGSAYYDNKTYKKFVRCVKDLK